MSGAKTAQACDAEKLLQLGKLVLNELSQLEPCQADVFIEQNTETKIAYEQKDFSIASSSTATLFGIRVIVGRRLGFVTTNSLDPQALKEAAREAQMIARLSPSNEFHTVADPQPGPTDFWEIYDPKLVQAAPREMMEWAKFFVDQSSDSKISIDRAELSVTSSNWGIVNSKGVRESARQSGASFYLMGMGKTADEVTSFDYDGGTVSHVKDLQKEMRAVAGRFKESVLTSLGARKGEKTYKGAVLFHPAAVASLLASAISANVNGRRQQDGLSKWRDSFGKKVASELITLSENPLDAERPAGWSPYDREGVRTQNRKFVDRGVLSGTAHNLFSARRAGVASTGNAGGGARSLPTIDLRNLSFAPGKESDPELNQALNSGLVLKRFSGNADPVSGEFSGVAKNSWWVKNGKRTHSVKEVMVAGNMFDLLDRVNLVGSTIHRQSSSFDSPYMLIDGLSVTAG